MTTLRPRRLWSYTNLHSTDAEVRVPRTEDDLRKIFAEARTAQRTITLRAGGHSFDRQSLGDDIVVSMESFTGIARPGGDRVRVGSGTTWGSILRNLQGQDLAPYVTVTTEHATAGGTLSGDCLSRFSPAWGKEGEHIESFDIVTPKQGELHCTRPDANTDPQSWTLAERVFVAAIGGLGYLGAITAITYDVLPVRRSGDRIRVHTSVRKCATCDELAAGLTQAAKKARRVAPNAHDAAKDDAVYSALTPAGCGTRDGLLLTSHFHHGADGRRMLLFHPRFLLRVPLEWLLRWVAFNRVFWWAVMRFGYRREAFVDDLDGYTFFMDGNMRAKRVAQRFGRRLKMIQQTFVVPVDTSSDEGWARGERDLVRWLRYAQSVLEPKKLAPTLQDVLFLPRDLPFPLSATADTAGFAVSYAFETNRRGVLDRAREAFGELSDGLLRDFGGRVYLVKNVCASAPTLMAMYGRHAEDFFAVKRQVDPDGLLSNAFLETTFPELCDRRRAAPVAAATR